MIAASSSVWNAVGWTMLHLLWVGTLIGMLAALARRVLRHARPETRYAVALAALLLLTSAPVALFAVLYVPVATTEGTNRPAATSQAPSTARPAISPESNLAEPVRSADRAPVAERRAVAALSWVEPLVPFLPWVWMAGSLATLVLLACGLVGVESLRRSSRLIDDGPITALVRELTASLGLARTVAVGVCDRIAAPVLVGIVWPMILLPPAALCGWPPDQLEMVLLHELAHLRRWDNLVNLAQRVAESLLFFHPVTWWLSCWIRLEREFCCDRLVVDRVRDPKAYAEMLASLVLPDLRPRGAMAVSMADGPMLTRIRRVLDLEDRSMKLSMPEGLGVAGAIALVAALAMGTRAEKPNDLEARRALARQAVAQLEALRGPQEREASRINTLEAFAQAQIKLGDRAAGVETLKRAFAAIAKQEVPNSGPEQEQARLQSLVDIPRVLRAAGETDAARAMLDQVTKQVDAPGNRPSDPTKVAPVEGDRNMVMRVVHFSDNLVRAEVLGLLGQERLKLGDRDEALRMFRRTAECLKDEPAGLQGLYLGYLGSELHRAGDPAGGRALIERARTLAEGAATAEEKEAARASVLMARARTGDLDGALGTLPDLNPARLTSTLDGLLQEMTEYDGRAAWYAPGWLKVTIGADVYKITDRAAALRDLPRYAEALGRFGSPLVRARLLARVAHLQAKSGDFTGAWKTAEAVPAVQRADYKGPSDGFYDAVRPITFALIARERAEAGDRSRVEAEFDRALEAARTIGDLREKTLALMVIGRERARIGARAAALDVLAEAQPLVLTLPEPRRSRSLDMIVSARIDAGDLPGAGSAVQAIRSFPRAEKLGALRNVAEAHRRAGDMDGYRAFLRQELAACEAQPPKDFTPGPTQRLTMISIDTFIDPDLESMPEQDQFQQRDRHLTIRCLLEGPEAALKLIRELPADDAKLVNLGALTRRRSAYGSLVATLIHRGDLDAAEAVIQAIPDPDLKIATMTQMAFSLERFGEK